MVLPYPSLRQGLVGAWCPSLGASGLTLIDRSGLNNHGTLINTQGQASYIASGSGLSIAMDGVDDWVSVANCAMPGGGSPRTVTGWIYKPNDLKYGVVLEVGPLTAMNRYMFLVMGNGGYSGFTNRQVALEFYTSTSGTTTAIPLNTWTHIAATSSATANTVDIYFNGKLQPMRRVNGNIINTTPNQFGLCGRNIAGGNDIGNGSFDDIRIYNRILTLAEISLLASQRGIGLPTPPLYDDDADLQNYPLPSTANRVHANVDGVWVPSQVRANSSGTWGNGETKVNQGGGWL